VDIERYRELGGGLEHGPELVVVEIRLEPSDAALPFLSRGIGDGGGQRAERGETVGRAPDRVGEEVVRVASQRHGFRWRQGLGTRCRDGQDLQVHASGIHPRQALVTDVEHSTVDVGLAAHHGDGVVAVLQQGVAQFMRPGVFFNADYCLHRRY
jgi:hypothetical protein